MSPMRALLLSAAAPVSAGSNNAGAAALYGGSIKDGGYAPVVESARRSFYLRLDGGYSWAGQPDISETRVCGSDVNPYLAVAAYLGAGLWGIERGLTLDQAATEGSGYAEGSGERLPRTLHDATERFAASAAARELFGDAFVDHFAATREWEWRQWLDAVTDWELRRYFEII